MSDLSPPTSPLFIHLEIDTYDDVRSSQAVVAWLEAARAVVEPVSSTEGASIALWFTQSDAPRIRKATPENWRYAVKLWSAGELDSLEFGPPARGPTVKATLGSGVREGYANSVEVRVGLRRLTGSPREVQGPLLDLLTEGSRALHAATGFIYLDRGSYPYENTMGVLHYPTPMRYRERVRGYYWANILSDGHLSRLGGFDRVAAEAPACRVVDLSDGAGTLALLQLTEAIDDVTDGQLKLLRDFLAPVLPGGTPQERLPGDPEVRVFEDGPRPEPDGAFASDGPAMGRHEPRGAVGFPVDVQPNATWEIALFTLHLAQPLDDGQEQALRQAVEAWATVGLNGGYGGLIHSADTPHATTNPSGEPVVLWSADLGSADRAAIDALVRVVQTACGHNGIEPVRLVIGDAG